MLRASGQTVAGWTALALVLSLQATAGAQTPKYSLGAFGKYTSDGMLIQQVTPGSPLERVGLRPGDVIVKMDGQFIGGQDDLAAVLDSCGGSLALAVRKNGTGRCVRLTADLEGKGRGVRVPYLLGVIGKYTSDGMLIGLVAPGSPAAAVGLAPGDLILRINNQVIRNQDDLYSVLNSSDGSVTLLVRDGRTGRTGKLEADLTNYELGALGEFTRNGLLIATVAPGTPADRFGLRPGDLLVSIDNQPVRNQNDFKTLINNSGGTVLLQLRKAPTGIPLKLLVDLMNNPLGAWCEPAAEGMRVTSVGPDTPANRSGVQRGDMILKVDDTRVRTQADLLGALLNSGGFVTLTVRKGDSGRVGKLDVDLTR
jgi:S1-C subfamily serine protease